MQDFKLAESDESFCCWAEYWLCPALYQLCNLASTFLSWWGGGLMTWTNDEWWPVTGVTGDDSGVISVISVWSQVSGLHSITSLSPRNLLFVHWHQHHTEPWSELCWKYKLKNIRIVSGLGTALWGIVLVFIHSRGSHFSLLSLPWQWYISHFALLSSPECVSQ